MSEHTQNDSITAEEFDKLAKQAAKTNGLRYRSTKLGTEYAIILNGLLMAGSFFNDDGEREYFNVMGRSH